MNRDILNQLHSSISGSILMPLLERQWVFRWSRRESAAATVAGMRLRTEAQAWSDTTKEAYILRRLRAVLRYAEAHSPYYQRLFASMGFKPDEGFAFSDFARLPVLQRDVVTACERDLTAHNMSTSRLKLDSTGGSTGKPVRVWLGPQEIGWRRSGTEFYQRRTGLRPGMKTALLWGHNLDPVASSSLKDRAVAFACNQRWFDCFRLSSEVLERYHSDLQSWRPDCIIAYAGALASLAEHVLRRGHRPEYPVVCSITGAEKLFARQRQLVEQAFHKPVYERYGGRDVGLIAFQAGEKGESGFTVDWANVLVEPETSESESAVLVTKLHADGMPMIRYRVGDVARFPAGSQPGRPVFHLQEVLGRTADRICLPTGQWITGIQFPHMMKDYPVREFMVVQRADYSIDLQIVPTIGFSERDRAAIHATIAANLPGLGLRISVVQQVQRNHASKLRPVISEVRSN